MVGNFTQQVVAAAKILLHLITHNSFISTSSNLSEPFDLATHKNGHISDCLPEKGPKKNNLKFLEYPLYKVFL